MDDSGDRTSAEPPSLRALVVKMLPWVILASAMLVLADEFLFEGGGDGAAAALAVGVVLVVYAIHIGLGGEVGGPHKKLTFRGMGATTVPMLLGIGIPAVPFALLEDQTLKLLALIGSVLVALPLAFALMGPWVLHQVSPGHRVAVGGLWDRLWRMTLIGAVPILLAALLTMFASGGDAPVVTGRWPTALLAILTSTIGNLSFVVYAWALCRTAESVSSR